MELRLIAACGLIVLAAAVPSFGAVLCGALLVVQLALLALRPAATRMSGRTVAHRKPLGKMKFSIHVATHSEPSALVIRTLGALLDQDWPSDAFEIIVMDNNTEDAALWKPVEAFCSSRSDRIRFLHDEGVEGAKAGALNIALAHSDPATTHVVTVDADYIVNRDFLKAAAHALQRTGADYVQFPQAYVGSKDTAPGVDAELEEYFRSNAVVADEVEAVLLTGTLCVISKEALTAAGGWSGATTTEDAELGVRLCNTGHTGRFINQVVGRGLLPFSLKDLEKQRYRWCSGNLQTLLHHLRTISTFSGSLSLQKRLVILSQLTAWSNLGFVPFILLMAWVAMGQEHTFAVISAAAVIVVSLCDVVLRVVGRGMRDRLAFGVILQALACRIALAPQAAKATFDALCGGRPIFIVTDKSGMRPSSAGHLYLGHLALFTTALIAVTGADPAPQMVLAALLALMLPLPAALITEKSLRIYRQTMNAMPKEIPA